MENCTKHYGVRLCNLHKLHRIGPDRQPSNSTPAQQQHASPAAARQPSSRSPARQQRAIARERMTLDAEYNPLRGNALDGMPHAAGNGDSTAQKAMRMADTDTARRLCELDVRESVLQEDKALIRAVLDRLNSKHKELLATRYIDGHNWEFTACRVGLSRRQTIRVSVVALTRLGALLQDEPQAGKILARARDACAL